MYLEKAKQAIYTLLHFLSTEQIRKEISLEVLQLALQQYGVKNALQKTVYFLNLP